jgi:hypothetical protein
MSTDSLGDDFIGSLSQFSPTFKSIEAALRCLNQYTSFLAFEHLAGSASHLSRTFHALSTQSAFTLVSAWHADRKRIENDFYAANLLLELKAQGEEYIQIVAHRCKAPEADGNPIRAFLLINASLIADDHKVNMLNLCRKYNQPSVALYEHKEIRIFDTTGKVLKGFSLKTMEPHHLKRVLAALVNLRVEWLETGYLTASPMFLCDLQYKNVGLCSDVPLHLLNRLFTKVQHLARDKPYRRSKF